MQNVDFDKGANIIQWREISFKQIALGQSNICMEKVALQFMPHIIHRISIQKINLR